MNGPEKKKPILLFSAVWGREVPLLRIWPSLLRVCFVVSLAATLTGQPAGALAGESHKIVFDTSQLTITDGQNSHHFIIEVANTPITRQRGLMERKHMDANAGMLFDYGKPRQIHMWMKNTFISLDMLFIDRAGKIVGVATNTTPLSTAVIASPGPVLAVLELNAGTAARLSLDIGDKVLHDIFQP